VEPDAASIDGNTLVTITSIFADNTGAVIATSDTSCLWNGTVTTPAINVTLTNVFCRTPTGQSAGLVSLQVLWRNVLWAVNSLSLSHSTVTLSSLYKTTQIHFVLISTSELDTHLTERNIYVDVIY
jgi:hypothetical protein